MKTVKNVLASVAAASFLIAQPAAAAAAPAERLGGEVSQAEELSSGTPLWVILLVFAGLLGIAEITGLIDVLGNDDPESP